MTTFSGEEFTKPPETSSFVWSKIIKNVFNESLQVQCYPEKNSRILKPKSEKIKKSISCKAIYFGRLKN
jgi:hypothetical protein